MLIDLSIDSKEFGEIPLRIQARITPKRLTLASAL